MRHRRLQDTQNTPNNEGFLLNRQAELCISPWNEFPRRAVMSRSLLFVGVCDGKQYDSPAVRYAMKNKYSGNRYDY